MIRVQLIGILMSLIPMLGYGKTCKITLHTSDQLMFDQSEIHLARQCSQVALTLVHTGGLNADVMGHNWVLTRPDDSVDVAQAGVEAGRDHDFVPVHDQRVVASTHLIGGGQTTHVQFSTQALRPGQPYTFFCSFPGHSSVMRGILKYD